MKVGVVALGLLCSGLANAQEEVCSGFSVEELRVALNRADGELLDHQFQAAWRTTLETRKDLRCLDTLIPPALLARLAHAMAFLTFLDQDHPTAAAWARLATSLQPGILLPVQPPPTYRAFLEEQPAPSFARAAGEVAHPKRSAVFLDGYLLEEPQALTETPHFVMVVDRKGQRVDAWWMDGVAFRDGLLDEGSSAPRWAAAMSPERTDPRAMVAAAPAAEGEVADLDEGETEPGWISEAPEETWMPDCPWAGQPVSAQIASGVVTVNGRSWNVDHRVQASDFRRVLTDCRADRALRRFDQYVATRRTNAPTMNLGRRDINDVIRVIGRAGTAVAAETHRVGLIRALEDPDRGRVRSP